MSTVHTNALVNAYLRRLEQAAAPLSRSRRTELVAEIREHIDDALLEDGAAGEAAVRNVLERLGPPEEIVAAAGPTQRQSGRLELAAMIALAIPFLGWLVGVVLVGASRAWTGREKAVGIAIVFIPAVLLALGVVSEGASNGSEVPVGGFTEDAAGGGGEGGLGPIELFVILGTFLAGPLAAVYLGSRLRRTSEPSGLVSA